MNKKGLYMYLWLALFTIFISFFSIILFNYVSTDIKVTRSIYQDSRLYYDIKSILTAIAEIYREKNISNPNNNSIRKGTYAYQNGHNQYLVNYSINPLNQTHLFIELSKNGNLWARGIVKWRESISDFAFITAKNNEQFKQNSFYSSAAIFSNNVSIPSTNNFIFSKVTINENLIVNGKNFPDNIQEIQQFAQFVEISNSLNAIMQYYRSFRDNAKTKIVDPMNSTYSQQYSNSGEIVLTPYGSIWIRSTAPSPIKLNFSTNAGGQVIEFRKTDNTLIATFIHLTKNPTTIKLQNGDKVISNDSSIINAANNYNLNINVKPFSKILRYYPNIVTIYTYTPDFNTIIYSEVPLILGSDSPNSITNAVIDTKITIVSIEPVTIKNNIIYSNFSNLQDYINQIETQNKLSISNDNGLLRVIAPQITLDTSQFSSTDSQKNKLCLNGQFVTMYDSNSKITISNPDNIQGIYLFGSIQFCQREGFTTSNFQEKYLLDGRLTTIDPALSTILDNIDNNTYINKISVLGIEIINK